MLNGNPWACDFHFCAHEECRHKNAHAFPLPLPDAASIKKYLFIGTLKPTNQLYKWAGFEMTMIQLHCNDGSSQQSQKRERGWQQQPSAAGELLGTFCSGFYSYLKLFCYLGFICLFFRPKRAFAVCLSSTLLCAVAWTHRKMFHRQQPSTAPLFPQPGYIMVYRPALTDPASLATLCVTFSHSIPWDSLCITVNGNQRQ